MRVLMLGWEFPPFITGGLGTACFGLTKAFDRRGIDVTFVLPKHVDDEHAGHVDLISPAAGWMADAGRSAVSAARPAVGAPMDRDRSGPARGDAYEPTTIVDDIALGSIDLAEASSLWQHVTFVTAPLVRARPYDPSHREGHGHSGLGGGADLASPVPHGALRGWSSAAALSPTALHRAWAVELVLREALPEAAGRWIFPDDGGAAPSGGGDYSGDLIGDADRYARFVVGACARMPFDVIHAHDWLTYPAGLALARVTGRPLVVHVHSTEFDRSGLHVNQRIYDIERRGMHGAIKVVSVSMLTKNLCVNRYGVHGDKIEVVYNGVDLTPQQVGMEAIEGKDKIVLYFGRITMQKGPEYFVYAAKRVLEVYQDVKFVVAGSGDQAQRMIELAASLGIGQKMLFTGFLRGKDIARVFALADLYVMPSVSEPFGIAPLEAMGHDVPVLISKTSGVSEVLIHALKCDFWDVDDMANKIVAVLRHPPLSSTLREHGHFEVRRLTWDGAAERCEQVYRDAVTAVGRR